MLVTSAPGGDSCRAMVSDVSMVKYTSMGHCLGPEENTHTKHIYTSMAHFACCVSCYCGSEDLSFMELTTVAPWCLAKSQGSKKKTEHDDL